jgi:hypothetical protein
MSTKVSIRVIATVPLSKLIDYAKSHPSGFSESAELVAGEVHLDKFAPDLLDTELQPLLDLSIANLAEKGCKDPKECQLEISIRLSSEDYGVRPALHVSRAALSRLAAVGATLDFDPYCS